MILTVHSSMIRRSVKKANVFCIDLNDLYDADSGEKLTLEDGVYAMSFVFEDNSGNELTYPADGKKYYFAKDTTPPDIDMPTIKSSNSTTYTLEWKDSFDLNTTEIIYGIDGSTMTTSSLAIEKYGII